jgi:hypothetical protein
MPQMDVPPYFNKLEQKGIVANKFAFYTLRSWVSKKSQSKEAIARDPLNNGFFIMGGGEEQTDLYSGSFANVAVLHDLYYNTNLKAFQVDGYAAVPALPLQKRYQKGQISNAIVDSGTSILALAGDVYSGVLNALQKLNPAFRAFFTQANGTGSVEVSQLNLAGWPNINFILSGPKGEDVTLTCTPQTYWQVDFPKAGWAAFQIRGPVDAANQSILGLPLLNNYYTVFDRSDGTDGVIRFAKITGPKGTR